MLIILHFLFSGCTFPEEREAERWQRESWGKEERERTEGVGEREEEREKDRERVRERRGEGWHREGSGEEMGLRGSRGHCLNLVFFDCVLLFHYANFHFFEPSDFTHSVHGACHLRLEDDFLVNHAYCFRLEVTSSLIVCCVRRDGGFFICYVMCSRSVPPL